MLGMESTTTRMQQAGWEFSVDERVEYNELQMVARNVNARMYALSNRIPHHYFASLPERDRMLEHMVIEFPMVANQLVLNVAMQAEAMNFNPMDAIPQYVDTGRKQMNIEDLGIFAAPLVRTKEIFVPEESVGELLDRILEYKEDVDPAYARMKHREGELIAQEEPQKFHAQIISLAR